MGFGRCVGGAADEGYLVVGGVREQVLEKREGNERVRVECRLGCVCVCACMLGWGDRSCCGESRGAGGK